jgi:hypothetical protein
MQFNSASHSKRFVMQAFRKDRSCHALTIDLSVTLVRYDADGMFMRNQPVVAEQLPETASLALKVSISSSDISVTTEMAFARTVAREI